LQTIRVNLAPAPYEIVVGAGLLKNLEEHLKRAGLGGPFLVVSQPRILDAVGSHLRKRFPIELMPNGEKAKTLASVSRLLDRMTSMKMTRQAAVIAVGGGVVGDVAGFAASIYMRGIAVVQTPTTLLAQVDSSIGGKTGVNHRFGKNLIGTFHQPRLVVSDISALASLPKREYASGLYEALKYGVICDRPLFDAFAAEIEALLQRDSAAIERLVARCAAIKADVVSADEREGDLRRVLNLGHTIGHALEAAANYRRLKHGEAVGYGMIAVCRISRDMGRMSADEAERVVSAVKSVGRLPSLAGLKVPAILEALQHDKKVRDGAVHFVLPRAIGRVEIVRDVPIALVRDAVKALIHESKH
jgi:3-dehydroquinate synthase